MCIIIFKKVSCLIIVIVVFVKNIVNKFVNYL